MDGKLRFGGEESTVGSNRALLVSNFTVDTRGFQYLRFKYYTENNNVPANAPSLGIGPAGWSETVNASVSLIKQNWHQRGADGDAEPEQLSGGICNQRENGVFPATPTITRTGQGANAG